MVLYPPLNRITMGHHRSDNITRLIQLTDGLCVLFVYNGTSNVRDPIKRRPLYQITNKLSKRVLVVRSSNLNKYRHVTV